MQIGESGKLKSDEEALLDAIEQYIITHYKPVHHPQQAELHLTTEELYHKVLKLYPNSMEFVPEMVAAWLNKGGFTFYEYGDMNFEWMLNKA